MTGADDQQQKLDKEAIARLSTILPRLARISVNGRWTRVLRSRLLVTIPPGESRPNPLWAGGTLLSASRYVPKGLCRALHLADSATTGMAEDARRATSEPAPVFDTPPESLTLVPVEVDVREVLDLTDDGVRRALEIADVGELTALDLEYRTLTERGPDALTLPRLIGTAAVRSGVVSALKYPSARRNGGVNLVLFEERFGTLDAGEVRTTHPLSGEPLRLP